MVADLLPHAGLDVVLVEVCGPVEVNAVGLVVDRGFAADETADEGFLGFPALSQYRKTWSLGPAFLGGRGLADRSLIRRDIFF
ncbi:hypothetical protein OG750_22545 [Streptomyces sp. NBC_01538]